MRNPIRPVGVVDVGGEAVGPGGEELGGARRAYPRLSGGIPPRLDRDTAENWWREQRTVLRFRYLNWLAVERAGRALDDVECVQLGNRAMKVMEFSMLLAGGLRG